MPQRPAVSVKIENLAVARPQSGMQEADIVWEQIVEGGITRFVTMYHSTIPDEVGSIRSVRPMDPGIIAPVGGIVAFSGGQGEYIDALAATGVQMFSSDRGNLGFYRNPNKPGGHNVYGNVNDWIAAADGDHQTPPPPQFKYAENAQGSSGAADPTVSSIDVGQTSYAKPSWSWSAEAGAWLRFEKGNPAVTPAGNQLTAANVIVLMMDVFDTAATDAAGAHVPETRMIDSGSGWVCSGGGCAEVTWSKATLAAPIVLTLADGSEALLAPGNTWIQMCSKNYSSVSINR